ncbi:hypothetical protein P4679_24495 [Priestia megaterium]|uniref:hypothetical protein n=1 Tax=Priestia megaterium TaxID=1404 RepID=UPI002E1D2E08|nr:hypothetical protein [Priestia megaterium]
MTNNKLNGEYVPGAAYEDFLNEKQKPSFINFMTTIEESPEIPESQRKYKQSVEELNTN